MMKKTPSPVPPCEFKEIKKIVSKNKLKELKELYKKEPTTVLVILADKSGGDDILAIVGHHTFEEWKSFFKNPNNSIKYLTYTQGQNAEESMEDSEWELGKTGKDPFYFFRKDNCYLLLALMLSDAFKVIFALTKYSGGKAHRSVGMTDYLLSLISKDAQKKLKQQGKKLIDSKSKGESLESVKSKIDEIVNEEIVNEKDPSLKDRLKRHLLEDIPDPMNEMTDKDKVTKWGGWIYDSFDGFKKSNLFDFYFSPDITEEQLDWLQNHRPKDKKEERKSFLSSFRCIKMRYNISNNYNEALGGINNN